MLMLMVWLGLVRLRRPRRVRIVLLESMLPHKGLDCRADGMSLIHERERDGVTFVVKHDLGRAKAPAQLLRLRQDLICFAHDMQRGHLEQRPPARAVAGQPGRLPRLIEQIIGAAAAD